MGDAEHEWDSANTVCLKDKAIMTVLKQSYTGALNFF